MLELKHISKRFQDHLVLDDLSLEFNDTGFVGIQGESGCGKSTLLYIIGMLDDHYEGDLFYNGEKVIDRGDYIRAHISYMMQNKDVIYSLTVRENIILSSVVSQHEYHETYFQKIVTQLGIADLLDVYPPQLSGGQLKRVSIAKALLKQSSLLLCDEPTGALHQKQAEEVMQLLKKVSEESLVIIVSHDALLLKKYCDHVLTLKNGKIKGRMKKKDTKKKDFIKKHHYSLWFYTMRQMIFQRHKLIFLFIFQWLVIVAFFLVVTAMNGVFDAIHESEINAVNANVMTVEKRDGERLITLPYNDNIAHVESGYHLDQLQMKSNQEVLSAHVDFLPSYQSHIRLKKGMLPTMSHEVIVSDALFESLKDKDKLSMEFQGKRIELKIVGVIESNFFQGQEVYLSRQIQNELSSLKNEYALYVESVDGQSRELYKALNQSYMVYSDVIERIDNYQSLLSLGTLVAYVFVGISFIISLLLIAIVESTIYFERKHDVAYLLSLGLSRRKLFFISLFESMMLGILMAAGGCFFSKLSYYYLNHVYVLSEHFSFELMMKPICMFSFDLYIFIFISYMLMTMLAALSSILKMMKTDMIDVLREE